MMSKLRPYKKSIAAVIGAGAAFAALVITSEPTAITASEWLSGGIGLATALGVYGVENKG